MTATGIDRDYRLQDRYERREGRVFLSGSQALVRLPMMQRQRDVRAGLNTAGFISGYTGSPLGGYDIALGQVPDLLAEHHIHFEPGINEDLGATAVWGSQQTDLFGKAKYDGVFGIWYGKGPGVDRSGDALKHGSYSGSSANGGVLVLAGDDHGAKSSTTAHQSDHAFIHFGMPYFNPSSVQEYLDLGLHGFAISRHSGCWVGMKCVTDIIESSASVDIDPDRLNIRIPEDGQRNGSRNARWGVPALVAEERQYDDRLPAVREYVRLNHLNREVISSPKRNLGLITTGKAHLDVMQALEDLGLDEAGCAAVGLSVFKIAMPWPLEPEGILEFADGHREILVVEEKRPVIEDQMASLLVNRAAAPLLLGKSGPDGTPLVPAVGEITPLIAARAIAARLIAITNDGDIRAAIERLEAESAPPVLPAKTLARMPSFCAGCPHNRSTKVPEGSVAFGGIGCHGMATFLPERQTPTLFQMGGEGAPWIGISPFTETEHIFQNLGDGTYYHSGLLAIRAAVAAGVNITYKILANDAIAMTGGQDIAGKMRVDTLSRQVHAEGVNSIAIVSDEPDAYPSDAVFAPGTRIHHRDDMDAVQRRMRETPGVTAIIYDQNCATELRRRRKRGLAPDPDVRPFINTRVCEGCGDCSVQSNCIAVEPVGTQFGRKRRINQSACNKDMSCTDGYCPSFVLVKGGQPRRRAGRQSDYEAHVGALPTPALAPVDTPFNLLVTGIGGSGVVTLGAILGMAAHLEGKGCSVLDVTGLAQRNGPVTSHVKIASSPDGLKTSRIARADLVIGSDMVVTASADVLGRMRATATNAVVNSRVAPTSDFASNPDLDLGTEDMTKAIAARASQAEFVEAGRVAYALTGNEVAANLMLVGFAAQRGWLPISLDALDRAIELNGAALEMNRAALAWGRLMAHDPALIEGLLSSKGVHDEGRVSAAELSADNARELTEYQDRAYARRYLDLVEEAREAEARLANGDGRFALAVARYYYKLLAYKDEYEVARHLSSERFRAAISEEFEGDYTLEFLMAPPILQRRDPVTGRYPKRRFGRWILPALRGLARLKGLRGTLFDPFGYSAHRKLERSLIDTYERDVAMLVSQLDEDNYETAIRLAGWPEHVRGYDTVKDEHLAAAEKKRAAWLAELDFAGSGHNPDTRISPHLEKEIA